jgi:hypothetical protein
MQATEQKINQMCKYTEYQTARIWDCTQRPQMMSMHKHVLGTSAAYLYSLLAGN